MRNLRMLFTCLLAWINISPMWADDNHSFPVEGKTYVIHRYNDTNSYIYENGQALYASASSNTQKQYWHFVPTENANCYYIQNVTSSLYIQSSYSVGSEQQIKTGSEPVEFQIVKNTTSGAAPNGYYYIASTDQTISTSGDTSLGLNYQQSTGRVVAYWIRYNRPNSYWDIVESAYDYEAPLPVSHSEMMKKLGIYYLPCGTAGTAWLKSLSVSGEAKDVPNTLNYAAASKPSDYYKLVRTDSAEVHIGKVFTLAYAAEGTDDNYTITAYFDWDKDGVFESKEAFATPAASSAEITVPETAQAGVVRMRLRLTNNGMDEADEDVNGCIYDFLLLLSHPDTPTDIKRVEQGETLRTVGISAYSLEGKQIDPELHKGVYIQSGKKKIK